MNQLRRLAAKLYLYARHRPMKVRDNWQTRYICRRLAVCGPGVHIYHPCKVSGPKSMSVGENVHINRGAFIRAEGGLTIEDNVHIARNVTIYTVNHNYMGEALPYDNSVISKPVIIERNVWIGINVTIVPGVRIGEGAIVGAGSVVARDIPPLAIVGPQPLRILKYRDKNHYQQMKGECRFGGMSGALYHRD